MRADKAGFVVGAVVVAAAVGAIVVLCSGTAAHAHEAEPHPVQAPVVPERDAHVGVNMRTDFGTHQYRLEFGARWRRFEGYVVLDPSSSVDGQTDIDVVGAYWLDPARWSCFLGWRNTSFHLLGQNRWHENLLLGFASRLPDLGSKWQRFEVGLELVVDVVRHGSNVPTEWISFSSQRHYQDLVHLGLFLRGELAIGW